MKRKEPAEMTAVQSRNRALDGDPHRVTASEIALYKTLSNNLQVGVYVIQNGRLQFVNLHMQDYAGYTEEEMLKMDPLRMVHPADAGAAQQPAVHSELLCGIIPA